MFGDEINLEFASNDFSKQFLGNKIKHMQKKQSTLGGLRF